MQPVYVPKDPHEKAMQRALMQWKRPEKRPLVREALHMAHREDLIGYGKECLLRPASRKPEGKPHRKGKEPERPSRPEKKARPIKKAGWAAAKPKKNARPKKKRG